MLVPRALVVCLALMAACSSPDPPAHHHRPAAKTPVPTPAAEVPDGIRVGQRAPDFTLPDDQGRPTRLRDPRDRSAVLLAFYPKDFTGG